MAHLSLPRQGRATCVSLCLAAALGLTGALGCSAAQRQERILVEFFVAPRTNQNSPVPLALVAVKEPKLFDRVVEMTAKQWFEQREQIRRDYPGGKAFAEWEWEYVPGQSPPPVVIQRDEGALDTFIFANYRAPGDHRFRLGKQRRMRIDVGDEDLTITPLDAPSN
jgi:type VI secretion system protein